MTETDLIITIHFDETYFFILYLNPVDFTNVVV